MAIACLPSVGCGTSEPAVPVLESKGSKEDVSKGVDNPLGADLKAPAGKKKAAGRPSK